MANRNYSTAADSKLKQGDSGSNFDSMVSKNMKSTLASTEISSQENLNQPLIQKQN
jgi:hypothetical protein